MSRIQFAFSEVVTEINALTGVANRFLSLESRDRLDGLATSLSLIREKRPPGIVVWAIPDSRPLITIKSQHRDSRNTYAEITSLWQIRCVPEARTRTPRFFSLAGIASTRVQMRSSVDGRSLGKWTVDVADYQSPGCYFHAQMLDLSAPRLPALHSTPASVLSYVLGELFQDKWEEAVSGSGADLDRWAPIQKRWLGSLLKWQLDGVSASTGAPWIELKRRRPFESLFLEAQR